MEQTLLWRADAGMDTRAPNLVFHHGKLYGVVSEERPGSPPGATGSSFATTTISGASGRRIRRICRRNPRNRPTTGAQTSVTGDDTRKRRHSGYLRIASRGCAQGRIRFYDRRRRFESVPAERSPSCGKNRLRKQSDSNVFFRLIRALMADPSDIFRLRGTERLVPPRHLILAQFDVLLALRRFRF